MSVQANNVMSMMQLNFNSNLKQGIRCQKRTQGSATPNSKAHVLEKQMCQLTTRTFAAHGKRKFFEKIVAHLSVAARQSMTHENDKYLG